MTKARDNDMSADTNANGNEDAGKRLNKIDRSALRDIVGGAGEAKPGHKFVGGAGEAKPADARGTRQPGERPGNGVGRDP
jgi:hypothetical protein